ncbi:MAG: cation transporter [Alicyclobacillus sp.]|nr:cation transporter [Alicyclobacillus sp.]
MAATASRAQRRRWLALALQVEALSLFWIAAEAGLSGWAALQAGSLALSAFSVDSAIEWLSGLVLVARLGVEYRSGSDRLSSSVERAAAAVVAVCLFVLAGFIAWRSGQALALRQGADVGALGLWVAAASSLITPWLAVAKRRLGRHLHSHALLGDAACSMTCAYMAWTLLAGLLLQRWTGWAWADPLLALGILVFLLREAWESAFAAWTGEAHVHHGTAAE